MATSHFSIKYMKITCIIVFCCICWLKFCSLYMKKAISQRCCIKEVLWRSSQNLQINPRSSQPEVFCQKMFLKILQKFTEKHFCRSLFFNKFVGCKPKTVSRCYWTCSVKEGVLKNFTSFTGKHPCWRLSLIKL